MPQATSQSEGSRGVTSRALTGSRTESSTSRPSDTEEAPSSVAADTGTAPIEFTESQEKRINELEAALRDFELCADPESELNKASDHLAKQLGKNKASASRKALAELVQAYEQVVTKHKRVQLALENLAVEELWDLYTPRYVRARKLHSQIVKQLTLARERSLQFDELFRTLSWYQRAFVIFRGYAKRHPVTTVLGGVALGGIMTGLAVFVGPAALGASLLAVIYACKELALASIAQLSASLSMPIAFAAAVACSYPMLVAPVRGLFRNEMSLLRPFVERFLCRGPKGPAALRKRIKLVICVVNAGLFTGGVFLFDRRGNYWLLSCTVGGVLYLLHWKLLPGLDDLTLPAVI